MALEKRRIVKSITLLVNQGAVNVQWSNQIIEDGTVLSEQFERQAFSVEEAPVILKNIDNLDEYAAIHGLTQWLPKPTLSPAQEEIVAQADYGTVTGTDQPKQSIWSRLFG